MKALADRLMFSYEATGGAEIEEKFDRFWMAERFFGGTAQNVMRGRMDRADVIICDYPVRFGGADNKTPMTLALFESERFDELPQFAVFQRMPIAALQELLAPNAIDFTERELFQQRKSVHGTDEAQIRETLTKPITDFLGERRGLNVEGSGSRLLVYRLGNRLAPTKIEPFLEDIRPLIALFTDQRWE